MIFQVIVGNVQFNLGKLAYSTDQVDQMIWIIISAVIGGGDLIFIIIIIINVYKPRVEWQNKKSQIQLDPLESVNKVID